ncbi:hypothetical protein VaNZ11_003192 [Volvox africanus]|uniref:PAS domain-containing protein n=1 Tax=Volvox africanus TaxID=51714 RepID=A0ABQ5RU23_9CHLO|nr:hypothetical protein VaNZ11_003192 [Volvox africanus]
MASYSSSGGGSSYAGSVASRTSASVRARAEREHQEGQGEDLLDRRSPLENGIFGVLFTLSKENSETRIRIRWTLLKILLDAWQLFTTVVSPAKQGWNINAKGTAWAVVGVLNFRWLSDLGYGAYLAVLYAMVALLMGNVGLCVWVAWCFKEHKFPVVWPIKVLRVFSSVFFQAFDVASLNLLQLGISCNYWGPSSPDEDSHLRMDLFPNYSCRTPPHILHAVVSALSLLLFVAIALLLNMAEVEVNPLSRRPLALGHSGAEVMAFAIKVLLTLVDVFIGYRRVAACVYMGLALMLAWQSLRWNPHLVAWVNYLKGGVAATILWCTANLVLLEFRPRVRQDRQQEWSEFLTLLMLVGLGPAFCCGALTSFLMIRNMTRTALAALENAKPEIRLEDVIENLDDPRDVEIVARCCRVWKDRYTPDPEAVNKAHQVIKAGLAMFPTSAYMVLLHGNFMIDVLGVCQSGSSRIEDARKLNPSLVCRFIMFVRRQQATQKAAGNSTNDGTHMDLLGYVEYQRKQRMVVRLHREALQAMCNFWKALDASKVSFMHLSRALGRIESSVSQAQTAYRVVLENYGHNPKLVRLYGKFLQSIKNDPWRASEYFAEADRLEEIKNGDARGPLLPDGTPLGRMDEMATAVLVVNASAEIQMANRHTHMLFGYKRGALEGKPLATLLAPHTVRRVTGKLAALTSSTPLNASVMSTISMAASEVDGFEDVVVGMHYDRLAFPVKLYVRKVSGVGEDSTFVAMLEPVHPVRCVASLWVAPNGTVAACDPQFVANLGWKSSEVNGSSLLAFLSVGVSDRQAGADEEMGAPKQLDSTGDFMARLASSVRASGEITRIGQLTGGIRCLVAHKYDMAPLPGVITVTSTAHADIPMFEVRIQLDAVPTQLLAANRKGSIVYASLELAANLKDVTRNVAGGPKFGGGGSGGGTAVGLGFLQGAGGGGGGPRLGGAPGGLLPGQPAANTGALLEVDELSGYTVFDFMPPPWKDMHMKFLKDATTANAPVRNQWSCRKASLPGPTLELRAASGRPLYMSVSVTNIDMAGETSHVVRLAPSSLDTALGERRLRIGCTEDGLVSSLSEGAEKLFGLDPSQIIGRGLWEIVEEAAGASEGGRLGSPGSAMLLALVSRSLKFPEHSWRVFLSPPQKPSKGGMLELAAAARATRVKPAIMQVHIEMPENEGSTGTGNKGGEETLKVFVDLWPLATVTGLLELDSAGRVRSVLEDRIRPVGLLFGVPSHSLVGTPLTELVVMPPGRTRAGDLLSSSITKKSSLKSTKKESSVKVGPVYVLQANHADGRPTMLDVQVVGKPGQSQILHAILRFHIAPMLPGGIPGGGLGGTAQPAAATVSVSGGAAIGGSSLPTAPLALRSCSMARIQSSAGGLVKGTAGTAPATQGAKVGPSSLVPVHAPAAPAPASPPPPPVQPAAVPGVGRGKGGGAAVAGCQPPGDRCSATLDYAGLSGLPLEIITQTGYSVAAEHQGSVNLAAPPPDVLRDGVPLPGVTMNAANKPMQLAGKSKLAMMVKSMGSGQIGRTGGGDDNDRGDSGGLGQLPPPPRRGSSRFPSETPQLGVASVPMSPFSKLGGGDLDKLLMQTTTTGTLPAVDVQSVGQSDGQASDKEALLDGTSRISTWVASKGAYFQNTMKPDALSDEDKCSADFSDGVAEPAVAARVHLGGDQGPDLLPKGPLSPGMRSEFGVYNEEDAASEGGQSALSAQSASGGAEYKRGKRFRKLIKLMDSSQAQLVQERFRTHALATVAFLAIVHIVCFALVVTAIQSQRTSMLNLGHNGEAQRFMHQIMTDVRSLDIILHPGNRTIPDGLYNIDAKKFVSRIAANAEIVKGRLNDILNGHHRADSKVLNLFYYTLAPAWNGNDLDGSDMYTNLTVWDFSTRFFTMATNIVENYELWNNQSIRISSTAAGQFILKSGPNLFRMSRKILDELLYEAAANVHWVDTLQLVFLAVEGTVISSLAAFYLAYLLRAVAAQRHKLYCTFLVVPLGLTRALASQNTNLLVDDDDDDDMSDEDERAGGPVDDEEAAEDGGVDAAKVKRRATLNLSEMPSLIPDGVEGGHPRRTLSRSLSARGAGLGGGGGAARVDRGGLSDRLPRSRSMTADPPESRWGWNGFRSLRIWQALTRRGRSVVPLPQTNSVTAAAAAALPPSRRKLKDDSHETLIMMMPFVFWSAVVITMYSVAVVHMKGVVEVVAVHSVSNFMSARTYRTVFYSQELAAVEDPGLLSERRSALRAVLKLVVDAWYTLQLGQNAYRAAGQDTERFPLVKEGLAYASPELSDIIYGTGKCHRNQANLPCLPPGSRFYQVTHSGLDSIMQQFIMSVSAMANNKSMTPDGLHDDHFQFVYIVGSKDLLDGTIQIEEAHYHTIINLFHRILVLHVVLFLVLWIVFAGFLILLLNPLLRRISKERRRIAELMSQLPLELDVERLVARALGTLMVAGAPGPPGALGGGGTLSAGQQTVDIPSAADDMSGKADATSKWKAIIRSASSGLNLSKSRASFTSGAGGSVRKGG